MKRFTKCIISFVVVVAMMCSMVGVLAYGTNSVNGTTLKVEVIDTDGVTVAGEWTDPATTAVANPIYITAAQMLRITASLANGGDVTVFSYADGTEESALDNSNIQYVGQEESGTVIKIRPRATLANGEYVMYVGGEDVLTPYSFKYNVGVAKEPLGVEGVVTRVPAGGSDAVTYKLTTALTAATDITDITVNDASIKDKCTVAYDETAQAWTISIADAGVTYGVGTYSAVITSVNNAATTVQFSVYDAMSYVDAGGNVIALSEITDGTATLKPDTAFNGAKVASVDKYFTAWDYNSSSYNVENDESIPAVDGQRTATMQTAVPQDGYGESDIISKTGAQWVKYTVEGDETEYDGIRFLSLIDFDAKLNGATAVDYRDLSKVTEEELANKKLTSGVGTIEYVHNTAQGGTPSITVNADNRSITIKHVNGNYETGKIYFRPDNLRTDAVKNVMTFKFKPFLTDADGNPDVTASSSAPAYIRFTAVGEMADGSEVRQRSAQWAFSASNAGSGSLSRGAGISNYSTYVDPSQPILGEDGYYNFKLVSYVESDGQQWSCIYDLNNGEKRLGYHAFGTKSTVMKAETIGHGFCFEYYKAGSDSARTMGAEFKDIEMHYEYDGEVTEIDHVGVVVSNVAQAPTIEAGHSKTERRTVYDSIYVRQGDEDATMSVEDIKDAAEVVDIESRRFVDSLDSIYYAIVKIPDERKNQMVYATPYIEFTDGTRVYGEATGTSYNSLKGE